MNVYKIAAFSHGTDGGNPAGVVLGAQGVSADDMQKMAAKIGYSETAFLTEISEKSYRVRYFSPESEVPFCGHATIALGAVLAKQKGAGRYDLTLNEAEIQVEAVNEDGQFQVALQSPPTQSTPLDDSEIAATLALFGMGQDVLHPDIPPARIHGGADHYLIALKRREDLAQMGYDLAAGRDFMRARGVITIMFAYPESAQMFHTRNAFASGGVLEDPATGAATAAFAGYLRDIKWPHAGSISIIQGEDMGAKSQLFADITDEIGHSIRVSGRARVMGP